MHFNTGSNNQVALAIGGSFFLQMLLAQSMILDWSEHMSNKDGFTREYIKIIYLNCAERYEDMTDHITAMINHVLD